MVITVDRSKEAFFDDVFKNTLKFVVPAGTPAQMIRTISGLEGHNLHGMGHESHALLLLDCLIGLPSGVRGDLLEDAVLKALVDCKNKSRPNKDGFLASLAQFCDEYTQLPSKRYRCMFFLQSLNLPDWVTSKPIVGYTIRPAPKAAWRSVSQRLSYICSQVDVNEEDLARMQAVEITVQGKQPEDAIQAADQVSRILRGAYLFPSGSSWSLLGSREASNKFKPSPLYIVREAQVHVQWAFIPRVDVCPISLPEQCAPTTSLMLDTLVRIPREASPREVLAQALGLLAVSGDASLAHDEFLGMWQALEVLSLVDNGSTAQVAAKIGNLFNNGHSTIRPQLLALAPFRNKLVHVGEYNSERQSATFLLSIIVRKALMQFAQLCEVLPKLSDFLDLQSMMTQGPSSLPTKGKTVQAVKFIRGLP